MSDASFRFGSTLGRVLVFGLAASVMPLSSAFAQSNPRVRVDRDEASITVTRRGGSHVLTTAPSGTVFEVLHMAGDPYAHRDTNWYLVVLPEDAWGRRHLGWIAGTDVRELPAVETPARPVPAPVLAVSAPPRQAAAQPAQPATEAGFVSRPPAAATPAAAVPEVTEVVLLFEFAKSALTAAAASTLSCAMEGVAPGGPGVSFALEGHADWTGPEGYNERLGLARAEAVKSYLIEQHQIPADQISVVSYGESQPSASNDTREGRAQNRRVVVKVGG